MGIPWQLTQLMELQSERQRLDELELACMTEARANGVSLRAIASAVELSHEKVRQMLSSGARR